MDAKHLHFLSLNRALGECAISEAEHLSHYDGLPTREKLKQLIPSDLHDAVFAAKQRYFQDMIRFLTRDEAKCDVLKSLKELGLKVYVASNSIRDTVKTVLLRTGLMEFVDFYFSNEDVEYCKPHPQIYMQCMIHAGVSPQECLILEDSPVGIRAAVGSGAQLCVIRDTSEVTLSRILSAMKPARFRWKDERLNILVPMAGAGQRFEAAGYNDPKPMINVNGRPMIQVVVDSLGIEANYIFVVQERHKVETFLRLLAPNCRLVRVNGVTEGAACTTLLAKEFIDNADPLLIVNSDQYVQWDSLRFIYSAQAADGGILVFHATDPKWSFVKVEEGYVKGVAEKNPISDMATCGIYYWRRGSDYVKYAERMIFKNVRVNNEFYVAPVYNEAIADGLKFKAIEADLMYGLGTPEDLVTNASKVKND